MSFLSHRAWRMVSLVAFATYFVFFVMSSAAVEAVVAATTADADAEFLAGAAADAASLYDDGFDLLIVTGVQS